MQQRDPGSGMHRAEQTSVQPEEGRLLRRWVISACLLLPLLVLSFWKLLDLPLPRFFHTTAGLCVQAALRLALTLPVLLLNRSCFLSGGRALRQGGPNVDTLVALGSGMAFTAGLATFACTLAALLFQQVSVPAEAFGMLYFESAAMVLTLDTVGKYLECRTEGKMAATVRARLAFLPDMANVLRNGQAQQLPVAQVVAGDTVLVSPGERIPVDGVLLSGSGTVDECVLKGESAPVQKQPGDRLSAATLNLDGRLCLRAERVGEDTMLAQAMRLVERSSATRTPMGSMADRAANAFVPLAMALALVTFLAWMFLDGRVHFALSHAISVLVVSSPCALGLAVPLALRAGTARGIELGVLFRSAQALEQLQRVGAVVLDKTGTLTCGKPVVTRLVPIAELSEQLLLTLACSLEACTEHPLAQAIRAYGAERGIQGRQMDGVSALPGKGVVAENRGVSYCAGSLQLLQEQDIPVPAAFEELMQGGDRVVYLAADGRCIGAVVLADALHPTAKEAVALLHQSGLQTLLLTGDNRRTAETVAGELGMDSVLAEVPPQQKGQMLAQLGGKQSLVAMVGSGASDASALQQADVGLAIVSDVDAAFETADVILIGDDLRLVDKAVRLSRAVVRNIRENLFWACVYNCIGIPLAAGVLYPVNGWQFNPLLAAAAMGLSCVCVAVNALRLRQFGRRKAEERKRVGGTGFLHAF